MPGTSARLVPAPVWDQRRLRRVLDRVRPYSGPRLGDHLALRVNPDLTGPAPLLCPVRPRLKWEEGSGLWEELQAEVGVLWSCSKVVPLS